MVFATRFSREHLLALPSNFSYYVKELMEMQEFEVELLNPDDYKGNGIVRTLKMARAIRKMEADILYLTLWQGYNNLVFAKIFGLIHCKIAIWKYTFCIDSNNPIKHFFFKHIYWPSIDKVYMMFDNHTEDALRKGLLKDKQVETLSRGVDLDWYSKFANNKSDGQFMVIATGKDHRDYFTLGRACEETKTQCHILTGKHQTCIDAAYKFRESQFVHFTFIDELFGNVYGLEAYNYLTKEVSKASVMAICCEKLPYGAGYTNMVECLAFRIPILQTLNPDVHLDPEKAGIGYSIQPYDVDGWKKRITMLKEDDGLMAKMSDNIGRLLENEYNSKVTTAFIASDFKKITNK